MLEKALNAMLEYYGTDRSRINHAMKVWGFARIIGMRERLAPELMEVLECAAALHDIGIPESIRVFGSVKAEYQQIMGAKVARELLHSLHLPGEFIERVVYLVAHHHSYGMHGGILLQILFEADTLAALDEGHMPGNPEPEQVRETIFRTGCGREIINTIFGIQPAPPAPVR